jgi:hypothetical protein
MQLEAFDLSAVRARLQKERKVDSSQLDQVILEFRRYIGIYVANGLEQSVTMFSEDVDEVWHQLILHTRLYQEFCQATLGQFLHHNPFSSGDPDPVNSWRHFESEYRKLYGPMDQIWLAGKPPMPKIELPTRSSTRRRSSDGGGDGGSGVYGTGCGGGGSEGSGHSCGGGSSCSGGSCGGGGCSGA